MELGRNCGWRYTIASCLSNSSCCRISSGITFGGGRNITTGSGRVFHVLVSNARICNSCSGVYLPPGKTMATQRLRRRG
eukprot:6224623-Prorocentrum_lima.AAC.1